MIERTKAFARSTPVVSDFYYLAKVLRDMPVRDWARLKRLNLFRKTYPYTMVGYARLSNAYELAQRVEQAGMQGAFVECGVWRGGCIATMAAVAKRANSSRDIWLFDSFEGLPEPTELDGPRAQEYVGRYAAPVKDVERILFSRLKINPNNVHIVKGWFQDTLPAFKDEIGPIAILRLDGDWYESTRCCLENLYDQIVPSGYVILDDYGCWEGCKIATDEFLQHFNINVTLTEIDRKGRFFRKP